MFLAALLLAKGLYIGQAVTVLESSRERVVLDDGESQHTLAPAIAANVFIQAEELEKRHRMKRYLSAACKTRPARRSSQSTTAARASPAGASSVGHKHDCSKN